VTSDRWRQGIGDGCLLAFGLAEPTFANMLSDFLATNRDEILARARERVVGRSAEGSDPAALSRSLAAFLDQLGDVLGQVADGAPRDHDAIKRGARRHGNELYRQGLTIAQVVHDYGDLCQVITSLAVELVAPIATDDFRTLNSCLDDAIAGAVTAYGRKRESAVSDAATERLGVLAHEMRNELNAALLSFASIKRGLVAPGGSTGTLHEVSLQRMSNLLDRSFAEVRLDAGEQLLQRVAVWEIIEEIEIGASLSADALGLKLAVLPVDHALVVEADRQILAAALSNLVQNALKFTKPDSTVIVRTVATDTRVLLEVEDECGGLPPESREALLRPFVQRGNDRTGLGLGLAICLKAVTALSGELRIRDLPGKGCIFTIDLPK
jgi:signal transduction histidine kinase